MKRLFQIAPVICVAITSLFFSLFTNARNANAQTPPTVRIVVPERFRVLTNQYFDLRIEAENLSSVRARLQVTVQNQNEQSEPLNYAGNYEISSDNDANPNNVDRAYTYRKMSFTTPGIKTIQAIIIDGRRIYGFSTQVYVQDFNLNGQKSIVLFIGDAMGTAYRDASRIVAQSTDNRFREGWFDDLQQMDKMPVTGMSILTRLIKSSLIRPTLPPPGRAATKQPIIILMFFRITTIFALALQTFKRQNNMDLIIRGLKLYGSF